MEKIKLPKSIDEPDQFLLWSTDEFIPLATFMILGMFFRQLLLCFLLGLGMVQIYKKFKYSRPDGYLLHLLYWIGLLPRQSKTIVNPFEREWLP
jgi:conjugal transfer pilus assembly protein TraL